MILLERAIVVSRAVNDDECTCVRAFVPTCGGFVSWSASNHNPVRTGRNITTCRDADIPTFRVRTSR